MGYKYINFESKDHIAILTLNSPTTRNSLSEDMGPEFRDAITQCGSDPDNRVLVLTGEGKHFSSGGDFKLLEENTRKSFEENKKIMLNFYAFYLCVHDLEIPSIAAINGAAIGAGFCLSLACDLRVATSATKLGMTFIKLGLHPGMAGTHFLPGIAGMSQALDLFYTGRIVDGEEALKLGIVNRLAEPEKLMDTALDLAQSIASNAPVPMKQVRKAIFESRNRTLEEALDYEASSQAVCYNTGDFKEGLNAVRNKTKPHFTGK